jgi:hypothetical protein
VGFQSFAQFPHNLRGLPSLGQLVIERHSEIKEFATLSDSVAPNAQNCRLTLAYQWLQEANAVAREIGYCERSAEEIAWCQRIPDIRFDLSLHDGSDFA